jgi:hypothetical protein
MRRPLRYRGFNVEQSPRLILLGALLFSAVAVFLVFALLGFGLEISRGKHVGWLTAVVCVLLATWVVWRAIGLWRLVAASR